MILSPIATQIKFAGCVAQLSTPSAGDSSAYNPASETDFAPGAASGGDVRGVYSDGRLEGLDLKFSGLFRIVATSLPDGLVPMKTNLAFRGANYQIAQARERFFRGRIDGYDLILQK